MIKQATRNFFLFAFGAVLFAATLSAVPAYAQTTAPAATSAAESSAASAKKEEAAKEEAGDANDQYRHSPMVTKLGSMVGMDAEHAATAFTLSNLLILVAALIYLLMKSLPGTFRSRSTSIKKQITDARTATQEASQRLNSVEQRLSKLDEQIAEMRAHADAETERASARIKAAAEDEKKRILDAAALEIQSATATARREIVAYAADLAVEQASSKLVVTPDMDRRLVESFALSLPTKQGSQN